jgi:hypothetical protein
MVKIDEQFIKEKINPVVGFIFHTARQLGAENAPNSMDMEYLRQSTERVKALIEESAALTPRDEPAAATDGTLLQRAKAMLASDVKYDRMVYGSNGLTPPAQFAVDFALSLFADPPPDVIRRIEGSLYDRAGWKSRDEALAEAYSEFGLSVPKNLGTAVILERVWKAGVRAGAALVGAIDTETKEVE